ncbi:MAG: 16S rRNA (cytosine(1402)-N(4))-methyltransferase [Piscirickettsiaceae bacterium CG_4_9_14_3_um_filter_43_564]|nr:16S rRNA (cytosine(1402)-N(4))-methyltransferase RsmH [Thiomicrospira sp.]OIP96383.1 MAG: 16S rRNA (cytosine(1402)-N(4))-methyltransferase [Thiomicrospira sp. CG2_30_44_34]PIQ06163.1 MAG: 16S rRNA (cytosine(1402)-N(4))-methyltransferase [Piscirickettsiaceae bacterium CG18_big_fil_WC_8_21_14_2_50_44_103]PIU38421.1 MAG: 16S rRNA (cytosine(1402)-N(4))-methyltransferase [Piscirickettsiaceae bacterium CG07_land_8_20_14_0_80_44_28]PIW56983.1 MAG: 16S rRNA (cytosine(1402)-N(4))-methyltransferase [P
MSSSEEIEQASHYPVMLQEAVAGLGVSGEGIYIDCTFGRGGHSRIILSQLNKNGHLLAIDQDPEAVAYAKQAFLEPQFEIQQGSFEALEAYCADRGWLGQVDGILIDLGVSSPQLDEAERGFSFMRSGPLDMRMNPQSGLSAKEWLMQTDEKTLAQVIRQYGEEKFSGRIARHIKEAIAAGVLNTTLDLANIVKKASPKTEKHKHPATRTFQAIRIAVNRELDVLKTVLEASVRVLKPGGRLSVISFHSLEDRIVKQFIRDQSRLKDLFPDSPIELEVVKPVLKKIGKPIFPTSKECEENPRSRSAVLRIAERLA